MFKTTYLFAGFALALVAGLGATLHFLSTRASSTMPSEPHIASALPDDDLAHERAEAALAVGDHILLVGSVVPVHLASGPADPDRNPIFEDDAYRNAWALLIDSRGEPVWEHIYQASRECHARAVAALPDGFIIAGEHRTGATREYQGWLLRITHSGDEVWRRVLGQPGVTALQAVAVHPDGTIIAAGTHQGAGWLVAVDGDGAPRWERKLEEVDRVTALFAHAEGVVLAGITGRTTTDIGVSRLIATDTDGQPAWSVAVPTQGRGELAALAPLPGGGGVAVGQTRIGSDRRRRAWTVQFGHDGAILSSIILPGDHSEVARAVVATNDGGHVIAGDSFEHFRDRRVRLWRVNADGALRWQRTYGSTGHDLASGLAATGDGGVLAAGAMRGPRAGTTRLLAIRLNADGDMEWQIARGAP